MKANIQPLGQLLYSPVQYVIPVFQRNYRWELPQWQKLWESLVDIQQPGKTGNHFMGFVVYVVGATPQPGENLRFHLIDGQQRLTTLSLLLVALRNVARRLGEEDLALEVHEDYLVHPRRKNEQRYRLLPKEHDLTAYVALVDGDAISPGRMAQAVSYFEQTLVTLADQDRQALHRLFSIVRQRLEFMGASLESENAYSIFKSLNSTGVPLSQADLIRNFVFMHVQPEDHGAFDRQAWQPLEARFADTNGRLDEERFTRFFRDLLMSEGQYVQPRRTFETFEARHEATGFDPRKLTGTLAKEADRYAVIVGQAPDVSQAVTFALAGLNRLDSATTYPLLLWLFATRDDGRIDTTALMRAIDMLKGFILRRFVAGDSSRGYGEMFVRAIARDEDDPIRGLEQYLLERGWPHDERFVEAFVRFPLYKRGYAREVLAALEAARGHKESASLENAQIEHVMPQTLSEDWAEALGEEAEQLHVDWLHQPGNLTLSAYNQEVGNQPFMVKRQRFAESNIGLTREISEHHRWTDTEIRERGERLARQAAVLWPGPVQAYAGKVEPELEQEGREARLSFWTGLSDYLAATLPEIPAIEPEPVRVLNLASGVRLVRLRARFKVMDGSAALVLRFSPTAEAVWRELKNDSVVADTWVGQAWEFDDGAGRGPAMILEHQAPDRSRDYWPMLHGWLAAKLSMVYAHVLPALRELLGSVGRDDGDEARVDRPLSALRQNQLAFWRQVSSAVVARSDVVRPQTPMARHSLGSAIGRAGFVMVLSANDQTGRLSVGLVMIGERAKQNFAALAAFETDVQRQLDFHLTWEDLVGLQRCQIACYRDDSPISDTARWPEYVEWMTDRLLRMDAVFRPLLRVLP